jgi:hypothetical protein
MKFISSSELLVFMNVSALSFKSLVMAGECPHRFSLCTSILLPSNNTYSHSPRSFSIHFDKLAVDFGRVIIFHIKKLNHQMHLTISGFGD